MKLHLKKVPVFALSVAIPLLLGSCSSPGVGGTSHPGTDESYYHKGRYYVGGRYETGRHVYEGRTYGDRYLHNGQYLYGGSLREYPSDGSGQIRSRRFSKAGSVSYTTPPLKRNRPVAYYTDL